MVQVVPLKDQELAETLAQALEGQAAYSPEEAQPDNIPPARG